MKKTFLVSVVVALFLLPAFGEASHERTRLSEAGSELVVEEDNPVYIMDGRFLRRLIDEGVDTNGDGLISYSEAEAVTFLDVGVDNHCFLTKKMITDLTGIEAFVNLETLYCHGNMLTHMDLDNLTQLKTLKCNSNILNRLDVSKNAELEILDCSWNRIAELDLSNNKVLKEIKVGYNEMTTLDLSQNTALTHFTCNSRMTEANQLCDDFRNNGRTIKGLESLDLSNNTALEYLLCCGKNFEDFDISTNTALEVIFLIGMPDQCEVGVWCDNFPPEGVTVIPLQCNGMSFKDCVSPDLITASIPELESVEATSTEDGIIYLVPEGTEAELDRIKETSVRSADVKANSIINLSLANLNTGDYWLYAQDNTGNISEKKALAFTTAVGIEDTVAGELRVYPNPASSFITVETVDVDPASIEVFSINGQLLFSMDHVSTSQQIDLSNFEKGMYLLNVRSGNSHLVKKIIKE